jgi:hypothetical protein
VWQGTYFHFFLGSHPHAPSYLSSPLVYICMHDANMLINCYKYLAARKSCSYLFSLSITITFLNNGTHFHFSVVALLRQEQRREREFLKVYYTPQKERERERLIVNAFPSGENEVNIIYRFARHFSTKSIKGAK